MQIKTTIRFHSPQLEWPSRAKATNPGEDAVKQETSYNVGGNAN
jgi:hypothetical protein